MASRHKMVCEVLDGITDLYVLADAYKLAIKETLDEGKNPYKDGACRLIAFQIAFVGNGDLPFREYYEQVAEYCLKKMNLDDLGLTGKVYELDEPKIPEAS